MNDQPSHMSRNNDDRSYSPKRKKLRQKYAPKACVSCRRSKLKCSGDNPCQRCRDNGKRCFYSEDQTAAEALQNLSRPSLSQQPPASASVPLSNGSGLARNIMPRHQGSARRTSDVSTLGLSMEARMARVEAMMEALLQDRAMTMTPGGSIEREEAGRDMAMSIPLLDPINPALVLLDQPLPSGPSQDDMASAIDPHLTTNTTTLRVGNRNFAFPTPNVYQNYIDTFFQESQSLHPCIDECVFRTRSDHMLAKSEVHPDDVCFLGFNYIIFAWRDISSGEKAPTGSGTRPGWHWLQLADDVVGTRQLHGQGDLSLAHFLLYKALYYCLADQPSLSYTTIGLASRYVFHHGLNRQSSYTHPNVAEKFGRLRTFWNILITDRRISLSCGRPYSIRDLDVDVERPSHVFEQSFYSNVQIHHVMDRTRRENGFLECMIHWSLFAGSLWDSIFVVTATPHVDPEKVSTFDGAVTNFFQETYPTIPMDPSQTQQIKYIYLSFNNLRLLARRQTLFSPQLDDRESHILSELVDDTIARVREYEVASEPPPYSFRHCIIPSLTSSLLALCTLLIRDLSSPELGLDIWTHTHISNFDITVTMLHDLAECMPLAQRVLVDFDKLVSIMQSANTTWLEHEATHEQSQRWEAAKSCIPSNVADLFPYRDQIPIMQTTQIIHKRHPSGVVFRGLLEDRPDPWVVSLEPEEVGRGVLWI